MFFKQFVFIIYTSNQSTVDRRNKFIDLVLSSLLILTVQDSPYGMITFLQFKVVLVGPSAYQVGSQFPTCLLFPFGKQRFRALSGHLAGAEKQGSAPVGKQNPSAENLSISG